MRITIWLLIALFSTQSAFAQTGKKQITMDDLWKNNTFRVKDVPGFNAMKDGRHYTQIDREGKHALIRVYNLETGKQERTLFDNAANKFSSTELTVDGYIFSSDEKKMLLFTESENIYRHSVLQRVYVFVIPSGI